MSDKVKGTFINARLCISEKVSLVKVKNDAWKVDMDHTTVSVMV